MSLKERVRRALASTDELEAGEELVEAALRGTVPAASCRSRDLQTLSGVLRSVTYPAHDAQPALTAELYDGSAAISLVWLGRREVPGIEPGRRLVVTGRLAEGDRKDHLVMYNPRYTLLPAATA